MVFNQDFLAHHGIKGQKWGVRRFQNEDRTLTEEGKERYSKGERLASKLYKEAQKVEPKITEDVKDAISKSKATIYGLEHLLKTAESTARKIKADSQEKKISVEEASKGIKDSVRYTSVSDDNNYASDYRSIREALSRKGYTEVRCRNYFDLYRKGEAHHKQITSVFEDKNGRKFELQFQTESSIKAKELKTPLYEESRVPSVSEKKKKELVKQMDKLMGDVPDPKGVFGIKSHG